MQNKQQSRSNRVVYVVDGARTPFLKMKAEPGPFSASDLAVATGKTLLARLPFSADKFDHVVVGCAGPSEEEANIARIIALRLGCGDKVPAYTVQRNCASGLQAIDCAWQSIKDGKYDLILAGGCEAMSRAPLLYSQSMVRWLSKVKQAKSLPNKLKSALQFRPNLLVPVIALLKGLTDPVVNLNMGQTAEEIAFRFDIDRITMDKYAMESHQRAIQGQANSAFDEITPLFANDGSVFEQDDGIRADSSLEKLGKLKPVFEKFGSITAGNSSQISDGAAFVVLASEDAVKKYQLPVLAKIVDIEWAALSPAVMGLGPVHAMTPLLIKNQLTLNDIDHFEINEAFAAQVIGCIKAWQDKKYCKEFLNLSTEMGEIDINRLNPNGGAIAIGHPVGASGARLVLHCTNMMQKNQTSRSVASLCIGGGQGGAILLERAGV
ncbi:MAG: acetyl-CoA C-acetyltransferase [Gammaproteobacteria bacterium]|jgi:acetyl-CoA C-acetyltransferase|nr:acetyl-CoA C-acetyltransferase [Gammaproteobacteria bacterium]